VPTLPPLCALRRQATFDHMASKGTLKRVHGVYPKAFE
jgi:hypothetical protein